MQAGQGQGACLTSPTSLGDVSSPDDPEGGSVQTGNGLLPPGLDQTACHYPPLTLMFNITAA